MMTLRGDLTNKRVRRISTGEVYQIGNLKKSGKGRDEWWAFNERTLEKGILVSTMLQTDFEEVRDDASNTSAVSDADVPAAS